MTNDDGAARRMKMRALVCGCLRLGEARDRFGNPSKSNQIQVNPSNPIGFIAGIRAVGASGRSEWDGRIEDGGG